MPRVVSTIFTSARQPRTSARHLFFGAEQMRVILREAAHARHAVEFAGLLPPIDRAELREPHRQVAIRVRLRGEDLDVVRAVHRLQHEAIEQLFVGHHAIWRDRFAAGARVDLRREMRRDRFEPREHFAAGAILREHFGERLVLDHGGELRLFVVREVAGRLVELEFADVRRENLRVALLAQFVADEVLQLLTDDRAVRRPQDEPLADILIDVKQLQIAAKFTVIAQPWPAPVVRGIARVLPWTETRCRRSVAAACSSRRRDGTRRQSRAV